MTADELASAAARAAGKPRLRGLLHLYGFAVSIVAGGILLAIATDTSARVVAGVYAVALSGMLGASALYHRWRWSERARPVLRRVDHAMIFVFIAGTYTPFTALALPSSIGIPMLVAVWTAAAAGVVVEVLWISGPRWKSAIAYLLVGWLGLAAFPALLIHAGTPSFLLLAAGGLVYTAGAIVYARRRPDPWPAVFGFHEVFHACVVVAAALQYVAVAIAVT